MAWTALSELGPQAQGLGTVMEMRQADPSLRRAQDRLLRNLAVSAARHGWRRIAVTSPEAGAGRTTTVAGLALSAACGEGLRAVALDLDLRAPGLARCFGCEAATGFAAGIVDVLAGRAEFSAIARRAGETSALGFAHAPAADPLSVLSSTRAVSALWRIDERYQPDLVLFDAPPLSGGPAARAVLGLADAVVLLAEAGRTTSRTLRRAEREILGHACLAGTVLTKSSFPN